jgi:hypothetical protein
LGLLVIVHDSSAKTKPHVAIIHAAIVQKCARDSIGLCCAQAFKAALVYDASPTPIASKAHTTATNAATRLKRAVLADVAQATAARQFFALNALMSWCCICFAETSCQKCCSDLDLVAKQG